MKILEITFDLRSGGAERFVLDLSNELSKTNDVTLLAIKDDTFDPDKALFYKPELSERVIYKNLGLKKGYSLRMAWRVYEAVKEENADVVHLHGHGMPYYCILALLLLKRKTKFYQTIHSDFLQFYKTPFYSFLFKTLSYKGHMGFVALSETNYREMIQAFPKAKGACIVNGRAPIIPTPLFEETKNEMSSFKQDGDAKLFLHVARCNAVKNQTLLVESFSCFVNKGYDADLVVIGDGFDSELGSCIREKAGDRIHFIGIRKNVGDYMLNADLFCLSSDYEGMPITLLEASLAGVPMVSTPVCGAIDLIKDGINGVLSTGHSHDEYVAALEYAFLHLNELKNNSIKMIEDSPVAIDVCARKYEFFFNA